MGSKTRKQYDQMMATLNSWITKATTASPIETQQTNEYNNLNDWFAKKDYRNLPTGSNVDLLPIADYNQMRGMVRGSNESATRAAGADFAPMVNAQRELDDNKFTQDWGNAYENEVANLSNKKSGLANTLQGLYSDRMNTGIQGSQMQIQNLLNRPKGFDWWGQILKPLMGAGLNAAASF